jgi:hypothetical protein
MRHALLALTLVLGGCAASPPVEEESWNRGYRDPFAWTHKLIGLTVPPAAVVDVVVALPLSLFINGEPSWFPITEAVLHVMTGKPTAFEREWPRVEDWPMPRQVNDRRG